MGPSAIALPIDDDGAMQACYHSLQYVCALVSVLLPGDQLSFVEQLLSQLWPLLVLVACMSTMSQHTIRHRNWVQKKRWC